MEIILRGNDHRYAAEQIAMHMFPGEKPLFCDKPTGSVPCAVITEIEYKQKTKCVTIIETDAGKFEGSSEFARSYTLDIEDRKRREREALQRSFYEAAIKSGIPNPAWGVCAGIRPATIPAKLMRQGIDKAQAESILRDSYKVSDTRAFLAMECASAENKLREQMNKNSVALYIGIPFCPTRCAYCSFVSGSIEKSSAMLEPYLSCLHREIDSLSEALSGTGSEICSVYIGGGTPTTLSADELSALLSHINKSLDLSRCLEYTAEAGRPDTITAEKLAALKENGADRISVNPQTFSDEVLRAIGRKHDTGATYLAFEEARSAGFRSINMDLIAGLPGDNLTGFTNSVNAAIALSPENITVHTLSKKNGSDITVGSIPVPSPEEAGEMVDFSIEKLRGEGYSPYYLYRQKYQSGGLENTGWAKPGYESVYNIFMMDEIGTVLALGGGGVTKLVPEKSSLARIFNPKYPKEYIERIDNICDKSRIKEFLEANPEANKEKPVNGIRNRKN